MRLLGVVMLMGCGDTCDTVIEVRANLAGDACREQPSLADCCPDGWEWLGETRDQAAVCYSKECVTAFTVAGGTDALLCTAEGECCPDGYEVVGFDPVGDPICVGG